MQRLDQLGCPSIWLGYCGTTPERLYSPQMLDMAEDARFTNYIVSTMVNKLSENNIEWAIFDSKSSFQFSTIKRNQSNRPDKSQGTMVIKQT